MCGAFSIDLQKNDGYSCVKSSNFFVRFFSFFLRNLSTILFLETFRSNNFFFLRRVTRQKNMVEAINSLM